MLADPILMEKLQKIDISLYLYRAMETSQK